jgi:hypothetical protein
MTDVSRRTTRTAPRSGGLNQVDARRSVRALTGATSSSGPTNPGLLSPTGSARWRFSMKRRNGATAFCEPILATTRPAVLLLRNKKSLTQRFLWARQARTSDRQLPQLARDKYRLRACDQLGKDTERTAQEIRASSRPTSGACGSPHQRREDPHGGVLVSLSCLP